MSSLAGIFYFDQWPVSPDIEQQVLCTLNLRDIDALGSHTQPGLVMAHASTWIDAISRLERQPHVSARRNRISFDGRLDNREDLLLTLRGHLRGETTDCSLALAAYESQGLRGLARLIGDWSIALWDFEERALILASDYAGARPLYYHANHERIVWSSQLRALVSLVGATCPDDHFVAGFLTGTSFPNRTPYRGIFSVPTGRIVQFTERGPEIRTFWELPVHSQIRYQDDRQYEEHLRALFRDSVRARLRTDRPVLAELSGGLDSSSVVCMATHLIADREADAPSVATASFGEPGAPDEKFYKIVQKFCGVESFRVNTDEVPFLSLDHLDDAWPAPWGALFERVSRQVEKTGARSYLTGLGGDLMMGNFIDDTEQVAGLLRRGDIPTAVKQAVRWSRSTRLPLIRVLLRSFRAALPPDWPFASDYEILPNPAISRRWDDSLLLEFKSRVGLTEPRGIWSNHWKRAPVDRRKHFRSLSRVLESRFFRTPERLQHLYYTHPFFHRPLVEFLMAIPAHVLCRPDEPRRLMRRAFGDFLPSEVKTRKSKASFTGTFLRSLRPAASALLNHPGRMLLAEYGYVNETQVRDRLRLMTQSLSCGEHQLRQIVLLEWWLRAKSQSVRKAA
jgi:asparagine synthase (glutamine-hydrolysing)